MIKSHYIIVSAMMALLTACSGDEDVITPAYTVGEADNAITLRAGIREGGSGVQTRAVDTNHANHLAFTTQGTMANLRIDGTWTGHGTDGTVTQTTSATIGAETSSGSKHNSLALTTDIFWDDYGTADPANTTGRTGGLTIYGVAVDGYKTGGAFALPNETNNNLTTISEWEALPWTLPTDQTSGWANYDLLTSNNVKPENDGTLKFDEVKLNNNSASDLLVFTHAMSKITVNLKAGKGFPSTGVGNTSIKFASSPTVTLTSNTADATTKSEWPYTTGNVNVTTKAVGGQSGANKINMHTNSTADANYTAIYDALVMPGSCFGTTDDIIARIDADGNVYYVTAEKIRAKMQELNASTDYKTEAGKNYIINVTVNKTSIKVTATITDWVDVQSEEVSPVINVDADWGTTDSGSNNSFYRFSFYRSTSKLVDYSKDYSGNANGYFAPEGVAYKPATATDQWPFKSGETVVNLYWPDHSTHYHFRGVWPTTSVETTDTETAPHVRMVSDTDPKQKIDIKNVAYNQNSFPSDLLIGMPELPESNKMCQNSDHTAVDQSEKGICATEGKITLNFRYVMSQVEVVLSTSAAESSDHVNINEDTKVEIVNVANVGYVKLGDRVVVPSTTKGTYKLDAVSGSGNELKRHSAIVPQDLTFSTAGASTNLRFKITVTNTDSSTDVYYADINPIKKTGSTDLVAPKGKWESGVHYIYNLKLTKTEIKVSATITDWTRVDASDDVWM